MKTTNDTLRISSILILLTMVGCVPQSAYHAYEAGGDSFALHDSYLRVDPLEYPVFSAIKNIKGPTSKFNEARGWYRPDILKEYKWEVSHAFNGKYLIYSEEYNIRYCLFVEEDTKIASEICENQETSFWGGYKGKGARSNVHVYMHANGSAYGFQFIRNPKRWVLKSDKISFFRVADEGDWSGQPWFECVERCEKLVNMVE